MKKPPKPKKSPAPKTPHPSNRGKLAVCRNDRRSFPEFWEQARELVADPRCPTFAREFFEAMLAGKMLGIESGRAATFLELIENFPGWSPTEAATNPWACPVMFLDASHVSLPFPKPPTPPPTSRARTAQVLDLRTGIASDRALSGEVLGICVPDSEGTLILGAPPGLSLPELQARMANMTGISTASLVPGPMATLPDGAFFALQKPGLPPGSADMRNYELFQLLGKDGQPPQPPPKPWSA